MYNYKEAGRIYDKYHDMFCDPYQFDRYENQRYRRIFMRELTRGSDMQEYIDYAEEVKDQLCYPYPNAKSKCYDFELEKECDAIIDQIKSFNKQSRIIGFMLKHSDGDKEFWSLNLTPSDMKAVYDILEKYDDAGVGSSIRGELDIIDLAD